VLRLAADEDFDNDILRGLRRRVPEVDVVRAQDSGLRGVDDPAILAWAADASRVLLTHDVSTMTGHAFARLDRDEAMPGILAVHQRAEIGRVIDDLVLVVMCAREEELDGQIWYLPLV
jgi:hypothetical protein